MIIKKCINKVINRFLLPVQSQIDQFYQNMVKYIEQSNKYIEHINENLNHIYRSQFHCDPWLANAKDMHRGERCFILATGPSLNKVDLSKIKDEVTFGVNGIYKLRDLDLNYFVYVSSWFMKEHLNGIKNVKCERRFLPSIYPQLESSVPTSWLNVHHPHYLNMEGEPQLVPHGFSHIPQNGIFAGGSVIFLCLQLAYFMGFSDVVLLGLDHSFGEFDKKSKQFGGTYIKEESESHFDPNYNSENVEYHCDLNAMERGYNLAFEAFNNDNRKIINASPGSKLEIFPKVNFEDLF